jgi:DNA-binding transcriptional LysR family regulator
MELRKLRYFVALAEELHFGRAARRLAMSQPPLSLAIRQLEEELGAALFTRTSRQVQLTAAGALLLREARALLRRAEDTRALVRAVAEGQRGRLRLGITGSMLFRGLPDLLRGFEAATPEIEVLLQEMNSMEQIEALRQDQLDLGFIHGRGVPAGLGGFRFHSEPFVACVPVTHAHARPRMLKLTRLRDEDFVLFAQAASPDYYQAVITTCLASGFMPRIRHEVRHWLTVVSCVASGLGVALVPRSVARSSLAGAAFVKLAESPLQSETWCVWHDGGSPRPARERLIAAAQQRAAP